MGRETRPQHGTRARHRTRARHAGRETRAQHRRVRRPAHNIEGDPPTTFPAHNTTRAQHWGLAGNERRTAMSQDAQNMVYALQPLALPDDKKATGPEVDERGLLREQFAGGSIDW